MKSSHILGEEDEAQVEPLSFHYAILWHLWFPTSVASVFTVTQGSLAERFPEERGKQELPMVRFDVPFPLRDPILRI